ncbi:MAG: alpha-E domain-containing protein [Pseudomonadota bacterium]
MASLIARFANNVFWLGRYLERAENLARIIDINESFARDRDEGPNWERFLNLYDDTDRFLEAYEEIDADTVPYFYMLDRDNSGSVVSSVFMARENARSVRHLISTEMWVQVNMFRHRLAALNRRDIRINNISRTCEDVKTSCQAFEGIAEGTFFRNEAWCFYQLGKYIERADQTTRVLQMGFDQLKSEGSESLNPVYQDVLLRSVAGYHAFCNQNPSSASVNDVVKFLLYDQQFPRAVALCVDYVSRRLADLDIVYEDRRGQAIATERRALAFLLETGLGNQITSRRLHRFLDDLQIALGEVSLAISRSYFN